jgi:hypothetical protein
MFKVSLDSLQKFIDMLTCVHKDHVQYSIIHILNVSYDGRLQIINCLRTVRIHWVFCTAMIRSTETFWSHTITKHYGTFMEPMLQCKSNMYYIFWVFKLERNKMRCSWKINFLSSAVPLKYYWSSSWDKCIINITAICR